MTDDINRIINCLTLSVQENEIKNLQSLSWAINKLENFPMTFDTLDRSRIGQTLQSVRHSKKISLDISNRIRNLIKCWRQLLNVDCLSVIPNQLKNGSLCSFKVPPDKNGIIKENEINGICHTNSDNFYGNDNLTNHNINSDNNISKNIESDLCKNDKIETKAVDLQINNIQESQSLNDTLINQTEIITPEASNIMTELSPVIYHNSLECKTNFNDGYVSPISPSNIVVLTSETSKCLLLNHTICQNENISPEILQNLSGASHYEDHFSTENENMNCNKSKTDLESNKIKELNLIVVDENLITPNESKTDSHLQIRKPKLKSTKELLADFSNLINLDTKNKILMDKIRQEDDDPTSYHPEEYRLRETIRRTTSFPEKEQNSIVSTSEIKEVFKKETKCEKLLKQFQTMFSGPQPTVIFQPMIPWKNLKRGIDCSSPHIRLPKPSKRSFNPDCSLQEEPPNKYSISDIDDLLQTFEVRAQRKDLITEAILKRKEVQYVDNTQSLADFSLKLTLKLQQPKLPTLKIKKRKLRRKKKKKRKPKPPPKPRIKLPRKPRIKPKPPITNFLDDMPKLPELTEDLIKMEESVLIHEKLQFSEENINRLSYGIVESYNCTKHNQTNEILPLTKMYSLLIDNHYFHVFPWVDLQYTTKSSFTSESDEIINSAIALPQMYS